MSVGTTPCMFLPRPPDRTGVYPFETTILQVQRYSIDMWREPGPWWRLMRRSEGTAGGAAVKRRGRTHDSPSAAVILAKQACRAKQETKRLGIQYSRQGSDVQDWR